MKEAVNIQATPLVSTINKLPIDPKLSLIPFRAVGDRILIDAIAPDTAFARLKVKQESNGLSEEEKVEMEKLIEIGKPANTQEPYMLGKIVCMPAGEYGVEVPDVLQVGMTVNYWHQHKIAITIEGKTYDLVRVSDVWGIP
jgi:hypothetical protein